MPAKVKLFGKFQKILDTPKLETSANTIQELIEELIEKNQEVEEKLIDDEGNINQEITILLNGKEIKNKQGPQTKIKDEDSIMVLPLYAGG